MSSDRVGTVLSDQLTTLELQIDGYTLERQERNVSNGFTRVTTVVALHGPSHTGYGEDVTYSADAHDALQASPPELPLSAPNTVGEWSTHLSTLDLFGGEDPDQDIFRNYRRWAFESAALDLALKQEGTDLSSRLERSYDPVRFVVSTRLGEAATGERILDILERHPDLEFKLDPTSAWTEETVDRLVKTDAVRALDLKGKYKGTTVDQPADPALYQLVIDGFPDAIIEDPALTDDTRPLFDGHEHRVAWDYPIRDIESITSLPWVPTWLNIKPSRFGSVESLFNSIEYCFDHDIHMFGGGQFELDVGREHLHAIASLFYPDEPNDVAPTAYNDDGFHDDLPSSPLAPPTTSAGLSWNTER